MVLNDMDTDRLATAAAKVGCMGAAQEFHPEDFSTAIATGQFHVDYQPQVLADGSRMVGVEALLRWRHPHLGDIPPSRFIPQAEKCGGIGEIGAFVLQRACEDGLHWPTLRVGVNVSPYQFRDAGFAELVRRVAENSGMPLERLEIEITEGAYFDNFEAAQAAIQKLRTIGVGVALDDFGTGYASLTYLRRLPLTKVKIDKSFVEDCHSLGSAAIIKAVVALSRELGLNH